MFARGLACGLLATVLGGTPLSAGASPTVEALLRQAEDIRSSDAVAFTELLRKIDQQPAPPTTAQRERIAYLKAYADIYAGRYDQVISKSRELIRESSSVDMRLRASALIVNSYALSRRFTESLQQIEDISPLMAPVREGEGRQHVLFATANLYNQVGQHRLGLQALDALGDSGALPARTRCFAGQLRLELMQGMGRLPSRDASIVRVINECVALKEPITANLARMVLARQWAQRGRNGDAVDLLRSHLPEGEATGYPPLISEMNSLLAEWLLTAGDTASAEHHAGTAVSQASNAALLPLVAAHRTLYRIAEQRGDPVAALSHYRRYAEADKSYLDDVKAREMAYHFVRMETRQKTQQIELLNRQNQVLQLQQRVDRQGAQNLWLLLALMAFIVAGVSYRAYKVKRLHQSLRRFAETDALTGISNRHHFTQQAEQSLPLCEKAGEPAALIMFDLDHFKTINDSYGHSTGDWVLQQVAQTSNAFCRRIDHLGRIGGEEFAILLHGCDLPAATRLAEDCRVRFKRIDTQPSGHRFAITASFGVTATSLSGYTLAALMSHADLMLYRAKRGGRDRVLAYEREWPIQQQLQSPLPMEFLRPEPDGDAGKDGRMDMAGEVGQLRL